MYRVLDGNPDARGLQNQAFACNVLQKPSFHGIRGWRIPGRILDVVRRIREQFPVFAAQETGLKFMDVRYKSKFKEDGVARRIYTELGPCKQTADS